MQNANKHALSWKAGSGIDEGGMAGQGHNAGHAVVFFFASPKPVYGT
jgi:hypothetical protein